MMCRDIIADSRWQYTSLEVLAILVRRMITRTEANQDRGLPVLYSRRERSPTAHLGGLGVGSPTHRKLRTRLKHMWRDSRRILFDKIGDMFTLPAISTDQELLEKLETYWVRALASETYAEACDMLVNQEEWPPSLLKTLINNHGILPPPRNEVVNIVTEPQEASGKPHHYVSRGEWETEENFIGCLCYDLPLNGAWSNLSAVFTLCVTDDILSFRLDGIEVQ